MSKVEGGKEQHVTQRLLVFLAILMLFLAGCAEAGQTGPLTLQDVMSAQAEQFPELANLEIEGLVVAVNPEALLKHNAIDDEVFKALKKDADGRVLATVESVESLAQFLKEHDMIPHSLRELKTIDSQQEVLNVTVRQVVGQSTNNLEIPIHHLVCLPEEAQIVFGTYVVQEGDTLSAIAQRFGLTTEQLQTLNNIGDPNLIFVGQGLEVPLIDFKIKAKLQKIIAPQSNLPSAFRAAMAPSLEPPPPENMSRFTRNKRNNKVPSVHAATNQPEREQLLRPTNQQPHPGYTTKPRSRA